MNDKKYFAAEFFYPIPGPIPGPKLYSTLCMIFFIFLISPLCLKANKSEKRLEELKKQLASTEGKKKVKALLEMADINIKRSTDDLLSYATQAVKLAEEIKDFDSQGLGYNLMAIGNAIKGKPKVAVEYFEKGLGLFEKTGNKKGISQSLNGIGVVHRRTRNATKAIEYFNRALAIDREREDKAAIANVLLNIGNMHSNINNYAEALKSYLEAAKLQNELDPNHKHTGLDYNIGLVYLELDQYKKAEGYFNKVLKISRETGATSDEANALTCLGLVCRGRKQYGKALEYYKQALALARKVDDKTNIAYSLGNIGFIYMVREEWETSLEYSRESLKVNEKMNNQWGIASCNLHIGHLLSQLKKYKEANIHLDKGMALATKIKAKDVIRDAHKKKSEFLEKTGKYREALDAYKSFYKTDKEIFDESNNNRINAMQVSYDVETKTRKIQLLEKNSEIRQLTLSRARVTRNAFIAGSILLLIILLLLFKKYLYLFAFWKKQKYVGPYRLIDKVGSGAIGTVFKAHPVVDKTKAAAVKILRDEFFTDPNAKKRFQREAAIIDQLEHPNIVKIFERGESRQSLFIAMEFLKGITLEEKMARDGALQVRQSLHILQQIAEALTFIHQKDVVHRDLKPANIMLVQQEGDDLHVKLLDFGFAKMKLQTRLTQSGDFVGTIQYIAPEQVTVGETSPTNDIFSMGVVAFRMLTGQSPFDGETVMDIMTELIKSVPPEIKSLQQEIPEELSALVARMLVKDPSQRPTAPVILECIKELERGIQKEDH